MGTDQVTSCLPRRSAPFLMLFASCCLARARLASSIAAASKFLTCWRASLTDLRASSSALSASLSAVSASVTFCLAAAMLGSFPRVESESRELFRNRVRMLPERAGLPVLVGVLAGEGSRLRENAGSERRSDFLASFSLTFSRSVCSLAAASFALAEWDPKMGMRGEYQSICSLGEIGK